MKLFKVCALTLGLISQSALAAEKCLDKVDGAVTKGVKRALKEDSGKWTRDSDFVFKETFEFQIRKQFFVNGDEKALVILLSAPGYKDDCTLKTVFESDVILYEGHICAEKKKAK